MKVLIVAVALTALVGLLQSGCAKMAPAVVQEGAGCTPEFPDRHVTYENYVKNIITTYCITGCHNGSGTAPGDFRTYEGVSEYTSQFFFRVTQDRADMPQGDAPLPKQMRDSLNIWIKNCTPRQ
jgi:hypothetical protein